MSFDAAAVRKQRGTGKSVLSRMINIVDNLRKEHPKMLKPTALEGYSDNVTKAHKTFLEYHAILEVRDTSLTEDQHAAEAERHEELMEHFTEVIGDLKDLAHAWLKGRRLLLAVEDLEGQLHGEYRPDKAEQYVSIQTAVEQFREVYAPDVVCSNDAMQDLNRDIRSKWAGIIDLRADTGFSTERTPEGGVSGTPVSESRPWSTGRRSSHIKVKPPKFTGVLGDFQDFKALFMAVVDGEDLSEAAKKAVMIESMVGSTTIANAISACKGAPTLAGAMASFGLKYEDRKEVVSNHLGRILNVALTGQKTDEIENMMRVIRDGVCGLKLAESYTAEQITLACVVNRLKPPMKKEWLQKISDSREPPTMEIFESFMRAQLQIVAGLKSMEVVVEKAETAAAATHTGDHSPSTQPRNRNNRSQRKPTGTARSNSVFRATPEKRQCPSCEGPHVIHACKTFKQKSQSEKKELVRDKRLCYNCLGTGHRVSDCPSEKSCSVCEQRHHSFLHESGESSDKPMVNRLVTAKTQMMNATASVVACADGPEVQTRLLVDTGAEVSLITESLARTLKAKTIPNSSLTLTGVGELQSSHAVRILLQGDSRVGREADQLEVRAQVVKQIAQPTGRRSMAELKTHPCLKGLPLADPNYRQDSKVDMLLGNSDWCHARMTGSQVSPKNNICADKSMFGWVVAGALTQADRRANMTQLRVYAVTKTEENLEHLLEKQWLMEALPGEDSVLSVEERQADEHFYAMHKQDKDGRHEVGIPPAGDGKSVGESRRQAVSRYRQVEKSLRRKGQWSEYEKAVQNFIDSGHAELVPAQDLEKPASQVYYMPMHAVLKSTSTSTKMRPVCDASAVSASGFSYNDTILVGPAMYRPLTSIMNQFRDSAVGMTADISKMYRQIGLREEDRDYHRFVFQAEGDDRVRDYRMRRLTFGVKSSPYLACKVLQEIGTQCREEHPVVADVIQTQFYMDDVLTGAATVEQASAMREELNEVLAAHKLTLTKWRTSSQELLATIPQQLRETTDLQIGEKPSDLQKTLGIHWSTEADQLYVATPRFEVGPTVTKRQLASITAQVYDPLGWYAPAVLKPRVWTQEAWKIPSSWDTALPERIYNPFKEWVKQMPELTRHPIPRAFGQEGREVKLRELHGFSDASTVGFGGVVFLRTLYHDGEVTIHNVTAKARVAPIKTMTIPRLELQGALVLTQLLVATAKDLNIPKDRIFGWTDSKIVLGWLAQNPAKLTVFVSNRVTRIQKNMNVAQWGHVQGTHNPADCVSRGLNPTELLELKIWWEGPHWLVKPRSQWPKLPQIELEELPEQRRTVNQGVEPEAELGAGQRDLPTWIRIMAWCLRFIHKARGHRGRRTKTHLTASELTDAKVQVFKTSQLYHFPVEYEEIAQERPLGKHNPLRKLTLCLDEDGLLRVGGRLRHADLPDAAIHPILLSRKSTVTRMLADGVHKDMRHAPTSAMMVSMGYSYYVPRLQPLLRSIRNKCLECQKRFAKPAQQKMGDLPAIRTNPSDVFASVGVDYAGPVYVKSGRGKSFKRTPTYLALFVCMATRAIHLEVVEDTSTAAFLAALDRFCGRRGVPRKIYSDNGSNFVGANRELRELTASLRADDGKDKIARWSVTQDVKWRFQPARSPNFGGLWEAGVKGMKRLMGKILKSPNLSLNELTTITVACEGILNSRPYLPLYSTTEEGLTPLTPGHFLVGRPLCALPQRLASISKLTKARRWQLVKEIQFQLWDRWRREYLIRLRRQAKQTEPHRNLEVGDVVLVMEDGVKRNQWPLGRVSGVFPGPDGLVRVVDVTVARPSQGQQAASQTKWRRTVRKLIKMPVQVKMSIESPLDAGENVGVPP